ncbi:hypothetical protein [Saccharopolyspora spinosa]|uniref:Uncharacterized protein n=1 Tax=Saccharopolyspora spinosa TaxID=60894 RepID=A0A2N3XXK6_SACSN|nr:hypothetical protein [Saccharopolyspora spinosa]PKW15392.1 hypothetical protein A8926_3092 [Saccharopolyspora spinosa]
MIKDESVRDLAPEQRNPSRASFLGSAALTFGFSAAQVWATSVLADIRLSGVELFALVLVLSAGFIAVLDAWKEIWFRAAVRRSSGDCRGDSDSADGK